MPPRRRQIRHNRPVKAKKLDQPVLMAAYAQESEIWHTWRARRVSLRKALEMVAAKEALALTRKTPNGIITIYREMLPTRAGSPTPCTLTFSTMNAVARSNDKGSDGKLSGKESAEVLKFRVWPLIGDAKAVAVRPRMSESERRFAEKLLEKSNTAVKTAAASRVRQGGGARAQYYDAPKPVAA